MKQVQCALFKAAPNTNPPFVLEVGIDNKTTIDILDCANIPDAIAKIEASCAEQGLSFAEKFTLLYPIYLEAMNSEYESTMHQIAWLIKDEADKKGWGFDRIGGYTGKTLLSFL